MEFICTAPRRHQFSRLASHEWAVVRPHGAALDFKLVNTVTQYVTGRGKGGVCLCACVLWPTPYTLGEPPGPVHRANYDIFACFFASLRLDGRRLLATNRQRGHLFASAPRCRVPVAPLPPAVPTPTSVPPTVSQQTCWRRTGQGGGCAAWCRS